MRVDVFDSRYQRGHSRSGKINGRGCYTSADAKAKEEGGHCIGNRTGSSNTEP
jgi:hypothetical protein